MAQDAPANNTLDNMLSQVLAAALENVHEVLQPNIPNASTATIEHLDNLLSNIQVDTRAALNLRRSFARKIPVEILTLCFKYLLDSVSQSAAPPDAVWRSSFCTSPVLLTLSRVSREWRSLILGLPAVWTVITDRHPDAFRASVERSRDRPVAVHLGRSPSETDYPELVLQLPDLGPRLRELYWTTRLPAASKAEVLAFPAPLLEVLLIKHDFDDGDEDFDDTQPPPAFTLFADNVPLLRTLHLSNLAWLPENHFASLTHLCLERVWPPIHVSDIFVLATQCPQLEHLAFIDVLISTEHDPTPLPAPSVAAPDTFPNLRRLTFDTMPVSAVIDYLRLFAPLRADAAVAAHRILLGRHALFAPIQLPTLAPALSAPLTHLALIRPTGSTHVTLAAAGPATETSTALLLSTASQEAHAHTQWSDAWPYIWSVAQLDALPLAQITVFHFGLVGFPTHLHPQTGSVFRRIRGIPNLEQLVLWTNDLSQLLTGLFYGRLFDWAAGPTRWLLPRLDIVVVPRIGSPDEFAEPFDGVFGEVGGELIVSQVVIHSPLDPRGFEGPLGALEELCPDVTYERWSKGPTMPFPDVCHDPTAPRGWNRAAWKLEC